MDDEGLRRFIDFAMGPTTVEIDGVEYEVTEGRLDGGWVSFGPEGPVEEGIFWQEPGQPLESRTTLLEREPATTSSKIAAWWNGIVRSRLRDTPAPPEVDREATVAFPWTGQHGDPR